MARVHVDGQSYEVDGRDNLLDACLSAGLDIPYFCWHPALGSVGACRQCAVKQFRDEQDTRGRLVMACMTPAADGTRISIVDPEAQAFRAAIIEWLMTAHPHDCPVCDEGGECHLQDMTVMTGHSVRRYRFRKRTFRNQYLGPFVDHEMNRCIACYRCVRYYRDYAGGQDLDAFALRNQVYFGRHEDGVLESEFAGNLVEVCPTGVFTDRLLADRYTRKWDLQTAPSVCVNCSLGCSTIPGERYGTLRRVLNRYHHEVNGYFLCDRGRFGWEFVNSARRVREPLARGAAGRLEPLLRGPALERAAAALAAARGIVGIGSPRASLEANFALRALVGPARFHHGVADADFRLVGLAVELLRGGPAPPASLRDVREADAVLVLGEDLTASAPVMALAARQAVRQQPYALADQLGIPRWHDAAVREAVQATRGPLFVATPEATKLDDAATETYRAAPDDIARLGFAVARELDAAGPDVPDAAEALRALARRVAAALAGARRPVVIAGTTLGTDAILQAAASVAWALARAGLPARLAFVAPESNSLGLALMGGPGLGAAFEAVRARRADTVVVLENDLFRRADRGSVQGFLEAARHVIVVDHLLNETAARAEIVLPAGTFAESDGTLVNNEGRAQRFFQVLRPSGDVQESWRWLRDLAAATGRVEATAWTGVDAVIRACAAAVPALAGIVGAAPAADFRLTGLRVPRQPHRYSGRTAMHANISVHEPEPAGDPDGPLAFSMEGYSGQPPASLVPFYWSPGWNSAQALNKFQVEVGGPLRGGDPGVRLVEPAADASGRHATAVPPPFEARRGEWLVVPLPHAFGSEELSMHTPGIADLAPAAYLALNRDDARALGLQPGDQVELTLSGATWGLAVRLSAALPRGVAGLPAGLPALAGLALPAPARITGVTRTAA
jgi:NADH-quinone oxidoreductase subunit G